MTTPVQVYRAIINPLNPLNPLRSPTNIDQGSWQKLLEIAQVFVNTIDTTYNGNTIDTAYNPRLITQILYRVFFFNPCAEQLTPELLGGQAIEPIKVAALIGQTTIKGPKTPVIFLPPTLCIAMQINNNDDDDTTRIFRTPELISAEKKNKLFPFSISSRGDGSDEMYFLEKKEQFEPLKPGIVIKALFEIILKDAEEIVQAILNSSQQPTATGLGSSLLRCLGSKAYEILCCKHSNGEYTAVVLETPNRTYYGFNN